MRYSVSGGGTGGHVYPALAVARALRDERRDVELDYIGGARGFERRLVASHELRADLRYHELVVRSLRSAGVSIHTVLDPVRLAASVPQAWWLLGDLRPAALFTTGGYLAVPLVLAARARRIPSLVWEGNVLPGRATRAVGRLATRVAVSFPPTLEAFPTNGFISGTPIRSFAGIDRDAARREFGVGPADRLLFVFGGSQAVARLSAATRAALPRLVADWHVLHVCGEAGIADAGAARQSLPGGVAHAVHAGALPHRSHGRCARGLRPRGGPRRIVDMRRARGRRRGVDPRPVSLCRCPPALQRRIPRR
jgi:UDP-N-acetylglucosamine--N-acetylmuramyl-(pentapeptide) pyrophosphoryl-undecaprenol N-acetylglucosamine transferase